MKLCLETHPHLAIEEEARSRLAAAEACDALAREYREQASRETNPLRARVAQVLAHVSEQDAKHARRVAMRLDWLAASVRAA